MKPNGAPSPAGRLILSAIERHSLRRPDVARSIGIDNRFLHDIIYGRKRIPIARIDRLGEVLRLTKRQRDELIIADSRYRIIYKEQVG